MPTRTNPAFLEIHVRVSPAASRTRVIGMYGDRLKLSVAAQPERGRANRAVVQLLSDTFQVTAAAIEIVRGAASSEKVVRLHGVRPEALEDLAETGPAGTRGPRKRPAVFTTPAAPPGTPVRARAR